MTLKSQAIPLEKAKHLQGQYPPTRIRFDWWVALLSTWFIVGLYLDGWAHSHLPDSFESFFTPWHGVLYTGILSIGILLIITQRRNISKGYSWKQSLPQGYILALLGFLAFVGGGIFDFVWHELFGSEADIEALLSPAHLLLATSGFIVVTAPLRSAWNDRKRHGWSAMFPVILSATLALSILTFFMEYVHFYNTPVILVIDPGSAETLIEMEDPRFLPNMYGVLSSIVPSLLIIGTLLILLSRWTLPFGTMTLVIGINAGFMYFMSWGEVNRFPALLIGMLVVAILADVLWHQLKQVNDPTKARYIFTFSVPFTMSLLYLLLLHQTSLSQNGEGLWWAIHMWLGVPFVAGIGGVLLSVLQLSARDFAQANTA